MKVCTDACFFGALLAKKLQENRIIPQNILDIGTGTGLLSLMLAQKSSALIDAIEINSESAFQAKENFEASPWKKRMTVFNTDALQFTSKKKYDFIISNPPFFEDNLRSSDINKNAAKHDSTLTLQQLITIILENLSEDGLAAILIPYHRVKYAKLNAAAKGLFVAEELLIKQSPKHGYFRAILLFTKDEIVPQRSEWMIHDGEKQYTTEFVDLLMDYYLKL